MDLGHAQRGVCAASWALVLAALLWTAAPCAGGGRNGKASLGLAGGWFKPNSLAAEASVSPFDSLATGPWFGLVLTSPPFSGTSLRLTAGCWAHDGQQPLTVVPIAIDVKHELIQGLAFRPYVSYGAALYWGWEEEWQRVWRRPAQARGYGATLSVGLDIRLGGHWTAAAEFDYLYIVFRRQLGPAKDYSGPRLWLGLGYML